MNISVSAVVLPSKNVRLFALLFSFFMVLVGIYCLFSSIPSFLFRVGLSLGYFFVAWLGSRYAAENKQTSWQISIDHQGQLRLRKQSILSSSNKSEQPRAGALHRLVAGTHFWSEALFLRAQNQDDRSIVTIIVLADTLTDDEFRRVSVAVRWIFRREP